MRKLKLKKVPTEIGKFIGIPFDKIKIQNSEGNIITVKNVEDDVYVDENGKYYNCAR